jgi:hypothetical protein
MKRHLAQSKASLGVSSELTEGFGSLIGSINAPQFSQRDSMQIFYRLQRAAKGWVITNMQEARAASSRRSTYQRSAHDPSCDDTRHT